MQPVEIRITRRRFSEFWGDVPPEDCAFLQVSTPVGNPVLIFTFVEEHELGAQATQAELDYLEKLFNS
jgi:hypothetical protein